MSRCVEHGAVDHDVVFDLTAWAYRVADELQEFDWEFVEHIGELMTRIALLVPWYLL